MAAHRLNQDVEAREVDKAVNRAKVAVHRSNQDVTAKELEMAGNRAANRSNQYVARVGGVVDRAVWLLKDQTKMWWLRR